ncbi:MAG: FAD-dependent oxidoreductase [Thermodesulfobacteriota bacterium]
MSKGIPYNKAFENYLAKREERPPLQETGSAEELLRRHHPDYSEESFTTLRVGVNRGDKCHRQLADLLQADSIIDDADLAGAPVIETDVLVIGGGGAGCAAALVAAGQGARVILATKLGFGISNTIMAEGGIQASIGKDDSPQSHYEDTIRGGHNAADRKLVARLTMDAPDVIRWLIQHGMQFDQNQFGDLLTRRAGGTTADRVVYCGDYTGLEMMRVLRESVLNSKIKVMDYNPAVELLSNEEGHCAGAALYSLDEEGYTLVNARSVILATGGIGRLHLDGFPTSNHFGATGDGLVLAYRIGARLRDIDTFQYHPTGIAYPSYLRGFLVTEGIRSAGTRILNGRGERFVDELKSRDHVTAAILKECAEGRGVKIDRDNLGVWLDTPTLERETPGILENRFPKLYMRCKKRKLDPCQAPLLIYPTLHYQNGGVRIDEQCRTAINGLYCAGEVSGGIHGRNRIMGNALLEIISFGRRAGISATKRIHGRGHKKITIEHVRRMRRELTHTAMSMEGKSPLLFPDVTQRKNSHGED